MDMSIPSQASAQHGLKRNTLPYAEGARKKAVAGCSLFRAQGEAFNSWHLLDSEVETGSVKYLSMSLCV